MRVINRFDACYGRSGYIALGTYHCRVCKVEKLCLVMDGSEGEYAGGIICFDCIKDAFGNFMALPEISYNEIVGGD